MSEVHSEASSEMEVDLEVLDAVSDRIASDWKRMARFLRLSESTISNIDCDEQQVREKAYKSLTIWLQSAPTSSNRALDLKKVLNRIGRDDIVLHIDRSQHLGLPAVVTASPSERLTATLSGRVRLAKEYCCAVNRAEINRSELDLYGDQVQGRRKTDLMVSLKCAIADTARINQYAGIPRVCKHNPPIGDRMFVEIADMFACDSIVLIRGIPGAGKTTLCHSILLNWLDGTLWKDRYDLVFYLNAPFLVSLLDGGPSSDEAILKALYPGVFSVISFDEIAHLKCLVIIDSIDECDVQKICARKTSSSVEDSMRQLIISRKNYDRIIVGRPHACDKVRHKLLQDVPFQFVEVVGFSRKQLKLYVQKFFEKNVPKAEEMWATLCGNTSLLALVHLPAYANIVCHIFAEHSRLAIESVTEIYVFSYAVFATRHLKGLSAEKVDCSTFTSLFHDQVLFCALEKVSAIAFQNFRRRKTFFKWSGSALTDIELTMVSSFIVHREEYLCFSHLTWMDFFSAVYLLINRVKLDEDLIRNRRLQGVLPMYFGLLGGTVENSDSPKIICEFVQPMMKRFPINSIGKHPLCGAIGALCCSIDTYLYLNLVYEFRNSSLLKDSDFLWDNMKSLYVDELHELDRALFFLINVISCEGRHIKSLYLGIFYETSLTEIRKLQNCFSILGDGKVGALSLNFIKASEEIMDVIASCCCMVSEVCLSNIYEISLQSWKTFFRHLSQAKQNKQLHLERLELWGISVSEDEMEQLASCCCLIRTVILAEMCPETNECWRVFFRQLDQARQNNQLQLQYLEIGNGNLDRAVGADLEKIVKEVHFSY